MSRRVELEVHMALIGKNACRILEGKPLEISAGLYKIWLVLVSYW
jgi:hypothetical protein